MQYPNITCLDSSLGFWDGYAVCMLDMARAKERYKGTPEEPDLRKGDIRKEGIGLLFRTSQRHWEVSKWT